jgi:hypothetical protein
MPAQQCLRLEDDHSSAHRREQPVEQDEDQPISCAQPGPGGRGPLQHKQLLAEERHLRFAGYLRSDQSDEKSDKQFQEVEHPARR